MTYQLHDYQQKLFQQLGRGFRAGEMMVISSGRQTGKSSLYMKMLKNRIYDSNLCKEIVLPTKPMKEEKYKFSRAKWYEHRLPSPFTNDNKTNEMIEWTKSQFGNPDTKVDPWATRWYVDWDTINFRDSKDYEWFLLRWS
jgi:hypothetical protein